MQEISHCCVILADVFSNPNHLFISTMEHVYCKPYSGQSQMNGHSNERKWKCTTVLSSLVSWTLKLRFKVKLLQWEIWRVIGYHGNTHVSAVNVQHWMPPVGNKAVKNSDIYVLKLSKRERWASARGLPMGIYKKNIKNIPFPRARDKKSTSERIVAEMVSLWVEVL